MTTAPTANKGSRSGQDADRQFRMRLLDALSVSIEERGYRATTVSDIVRGARTSRRTFYQEFATKEDCFIELLRAANAEMIGEIVAATDPDAKWTVQVRQAVEAYVRAMQTQPALTLSWIRELPALGPGARPVQREAIETLIETLTSLTTTPRMQADGIAPISRPLAILLLGGLRELSAVAVEDGQSLVSVTETMVSACIALVGPRTDGD